MIVNIDLYNSRNLLYKLRFLGVSLWRLVWTKLLGTMW